MRNKHLLVLLLLAGSIGWQETAFAQGKDAISIVTVKPKAQRFETDGEFVAKMPIDRSLESLMEENHFASADAAVFTEALNRLLHRQGLVAGDIVAIYGVRQSAQSPQLRPVQLSLYGSGAYVGTLSRADNGMVGLGADPWVYERLADYAGPPGVLMRHSPSTVPQTITAEVALEKENGTFVVPVLINEAITLGFVVDSGAADVSIPADVVGTLIRAGTISSEDFLGPQTYTLADGSSVTSETFRIRSLRVGDMIIENTMASVASASGLLLLGQSFLSNFKAWSIDNSKRVLVLESSPVSVAGDPLMVVK